MPAGIAHTSMFRTIALAVTVWIAGAAVFFRYTWRSGLDLVAGNVLDGRLNAYFHEHLYQWLLGRVRLTSPPFFYPQPNVFGYSDAWLLDLAPYATFRLLGLDPYLSMHFTFVGLSLLCFVSTVLVLTRFLHIRTWIALVAALLITFPNNLFFKTYAGHVQFFAIYYVPFIVLLALHGVKHFPRVTASSIAFTALAALLFALLFATAFYTAWLFAFTCLIAAAAAGWTLRRRLGGFTRQNARPLAVLGAAAAAGFAVGLVPFIVIYAPAAAVLPGRTMWEYMVYAPFPIDVINAGNANVVWGSLMERLFGVRGTESERALAVTPGMALIFLALAMLTLRRKATGAESDGVAKTVVIACAAVWFFSWLLTLKIGTFSLYWIVYSIVPGASAVRAGARVQLLVNLWVVCGLAVLVEQWASRVSAAGNRAGRAAIAAVLAFCVIEQINNPADVGMSRSEFRQELAAVPAPPSECRVFVLDGAKPIGSMEHLDAMWISMKTGLPTINGGSGWDPPHWRLMDRRIKYDDAVRDWIARNDISERICVYNTWEKRWSPLPPR